MVSLRAARLREDLHMPAITDPDEKDREGATLNFQGSMHASLLPTKI